MLGRKVPSKNTCNKIGFPWVPVEIIARNKVPASKFSLRTSFLTVISRAIWGKHILTFFDIKHIFPTLFLPVISRGA
jgi:hypothetical protein